MVPLKHLVYAFLLLIAPGFVQASASAGGSSSRTLALEASAEAFNNILPFWLKHARNPANGGFYGQVAADLTPRANEARGSLLTSRILWTFSAAHRVSPREEYKEMAHYALRDLLDHFWDKEHGGVFWSLHADGRPKENAKQVYAQAFAVYGLSEYARAFQDQESQDRALELYQLIEKHAYEPVHGGYVETCDRKWTRQKLKGRTVMGPAADKSQNTNLHVMEAWTNLLRLWPDEALRESQKRLIKVMSTRVLDVKSGHLHLFQNDDWSPTSDTYSYGHDIEFSWLLTEAADVLGEHALIEQARKIAVRIVDVTAAEGMDSDGGIYHEGKGGKVTGRGKEWWPQAEALVGFINAHQITGDAKYLDLAHRSWSFIQTKQVDHQGGEWFLYAPADETWAKRMPKISFWKCCYHNSRACFEAAERLGNLEANAGTP